MVLQSVYVAVRVRGVVGRVFVCGGAMSKGAWSGTWCGRGCRWWLVRLPLSCARA